MEARRHSALKDSVRSIPDYPKPGIIFRDITTLLSDGLAQQTDQLTVQHLVPAGHGAGRERLGAAIRAGHEAAGLAHENDAGRDVPGPSRPSLLATVPIERPASPSTEHPAWKPAATPP
jgi:hypothetical protein